MASPKQNDNSTSSPSPSPSPSPSAPPELVEDSPLTIPNAILHLIDKQNSVELATGDLVVHRLGNGNETVAVLASISDEIQWPLTKDVASVKLDDQHYFFTFTAPKEGKGNETEPSGDEVLSYGLTIASSGEGEGEESLVRQLDAVLERCSSFSVQKVEGKEGAEAEVLNLDLVAADLVSEKGKEVAEERCAAYWTTLAPNVEEYSGNAAKYIASGSGHLIKGILWCGDVTSDNLKWGNEVLRNRMVRGAKAEISPQTLQRIQRVKSVSKMTEKVALGVLSGAVRVSGYFTSSVVNSRVGKKFFGLLPGEVLLASLDGFSKICDAVEVAGKNVMSTSSTVTTELVDHRYGEEAAKATSEGLDAAGHAVGVAWTVLKLRQALNPKSVLKPTSLTKAAAAAEKKAKDSM